MANPLQSTRLPIHVLARWLQFHAPPIAAMIVFGLMVLSPLYRSSEEASIQSFVNWDTRMMHLPRLVYASDAWREAHELPLWNPFQDLGFPNVVDPQTQLWSPVTWLIVVLNGYSLRAVQAQLIGAFLLAGLGCYAAASTLAHSRAVAWMAGVSYMFCGYFATCAGLLGTFSTMAYFPWALACVMMAARRSKGAIGWMALASLMLAQCSVGGHPTTALVGALNLALLWLALARTSQPLPRRLLLLLFLAALTAMISWPQIHGILWSQNSFRAFRPRTLTWAEMDALPARSLFAFVLPEFPYFSPLRYQGTDPAHLGCYPGLAALLGLGIVLLRKRRPRVATILLFATGANLLLALGPAASLRQAFYFFVPGMTAPHHPLMDFRGFALLEGILAATWGWTRLLAAHRAQRLQALRLGRTFAASIVILFLFGFVATGIAGTLPARPEPDLLTIGAPAPNRAVLLAQSLFSQAAMAAGLSAILMAIRRTSSSRAAIALCLFVAFDSSYAMRRTWALTADLVTRAMDRFEADIQRRRPRDFKPGQFFTFREEGPLWVGIRLHEAEIRGYNPPMTLIPDDLATIAQIRGRFPEYFPSRAVLLASDGRAVQNRAHIVELGPNSMKWTVDAPEEGMHLRVLSSWFDGWTYRVDHQPATSLPRAVGSPQILEVPVPKGTSEVFFQFRPRWIRPAIAVMIAGYAVALLIAAASLLRMERP